MWQDNWQAGTTGPQGPAGLPRRVAADLRAAYASPASRQAGMVLAGNALAGVLGFIITVILSRQLGPASFGMLSVAAAAAVTISGLMDFGLSVGMVRFVSAHLAGQPDRVEGMLNTALLARATGSAALLVVGWLLSPWLAEFLFHDVGYWWAVVLALLGGLVLSGVSHVTSALQAYQRFAWVGLLPLSATMARLVLVLLVVFGPLFTLGSAMAAFLLAPLTGLLLGGLLLPRRSWSPAGVDHRRNLRDLSHFIKWLSLAGLVSAALSRADLLMLSWLRTSEAAGVYAVAQQLTLPVMMGIAAAGAVFTPRVSRYTARAEYARYIGQVARLGLVGLVAGVAVSFPLLPLVGLVFGSAYAEAGGVFQVLLIAYLLYAPLYLIGIAATAMELPQVSAFVTIAQSAVTVAGNLVLIPVLGVYGPAFTALAGIVLCHGAQAAFLVYRVDRMPEVI